MYQILPFVEQDNAYRQSTGANGDASHNAVVRLYLCPGRSQLAVKTGTSGLGAAGATCDYALNTHINSGSNAIHAGTGGHWMADQRRRLADVTDGTSNVIFAGGKHMDPAYYTNNTPTKYDGSFYAGGLHATARSGWFVQQDKLGDGWEVDQYGSAFPGACPFLLCDGSVRGIAYGFDLGYLVAPCDGLVALPPD